jgi:peptidoglycan/xylan/chitin deacetylase (PgdA/CDA1 family)
MLIKRRQLPLLWITLLIVLCVLNTVVAKRHQRRRKHPDGCDGKDNDKNVDDDHRHRHHDDDGDDDHHGHHDHDDDHHDHDDDHHDHDDDHHDHDDDHHDHDDDHHDHDDDHHDHDDDHHDHDDDHHDHDDDHHDHDDDHHDHDDDHHDHDDDHHDHDDDHHDHDDDHHDHDDDHDDYDDEDGDHDHKKGHDDDKEGVPAVPTIPVETPEFITPENKTWLEGIDFSKITGKVRPIGSGICKNAKCDGTDNDRCFESCGNMATPDDVYGCHADKTWALTFDDGPSNYTMELLDILQAHKIKATFVVMGAHAKQFPHVIKRIYDSGHQIASHTYSHPHLMSLTNEKVVYEIRATEEAIKEAIGVTPRYIRPPYGEADSRVKGILKQMGYKVLMWNVDPTDYSVHMLPDGAERIVRAFEKALDGSKNPLNAHNDKGYISLQHGKISIGIICV